MLRIASVVHDHEPIRKPDPGNLFPDEPLRTVVLTIVDDDDTCSVCGYMFHDEYEDYYNPDSDDEEEDDDFFEEDHNDEICENCTYWQTHHLGSAHGMICQKTGENTDPDDSCSYFSRMFHFSNYGEEGQYSFVDTEEEKKRKLHNWRSRKF